METQTIILGKDGQLVKSILSVEEIKSIIENREKEVMREANASEGEIDLNNYPKLKNLLTYHIRKPEETLIRGIKDIADFGHVTVKETCENMEVLLKADPASGVAIVLAVSAGIHKTSKIN